MKWYQKLYIGKKIKKDREQVIKNVETGVGMPDVFLITLAANERDLFDIFLADFLFQPVLHGHCPMIVGVARGWHEAVDIATGIALDAYRKNGDFDVRKFLQSRIPDGEEMFYEYPMEKLKKRKLFQFRK